MNPFECHDCLKTPASTSPRVLQVRSCDPKTLCPTVYAVSRSRLLAELIDRRRAEDVVCDVAVQYKAETIAGAEAVADDGQRQGPEVCSHVNAVIGLQVDVRLSPLSDGPAVQHDCGLAAVIKDPGQLNPLGDGDGAESACGID